MDLKLFPYLNFEARSTRLKDDAGLAKASAAKMENCTVFSTLMDNHGTLTQMEDPHTPPRLLLDSKLRKSTISFY